MRKFLPSELILNLDGSVYHLNLQPDQIASTIITVGDPDRVAKVSSLFDRVDTKVQKREFVTHTGELNGKRLSVISTGIGTDNIDIVLNELDALVNIDLANRIEKSETTSLDIIRIGTTGSMQEEVEVDSFLVSEHAIGLEGLMHFYDYKNNADGFMVYLDFMEKMKDKVQFPIRPYLAEGDKTLIEKWASDFQKGITVTCTGFYGPQGRSLRATAAVDNLLDELSNFQYKKLKCTNFEMETAGIYGLANLLGHRAISFNAILANRVSKTYSSNQKNTVEKLIRTVLTRITE